jgi:hypothetical protein
MTAIRTAQAPARQRCFSFSPFQLTTSLDGLSCNPPSPHFHICRNLHTVGQILMTPPKVNCSMLGRWGDARVDVWARGCETGERMQKGIHSAHVHEYEFGSSIIIIKRREGIIAFALFLK